MAIFSAFFLKKKNIVSFALPVLGFSFFVSGCSGFTDSIGFGRNPPDEFAVVDRAPLSIPPNFDLRPPALGAPRPQETSATARAQAKIFSPNTESQEHDDLKTSDQSSSEKSLLTSAGANKSDPKIRDVIDREASQKISGSQHLVDQVLWWKQNEAPAAIVNAEEEAQRLQDVKKAGAPINTGGTPVIERKKAGLLEM